MKIPSIMPIFKLGITSALVAICLVACSGSLTRANFDKITNGMAAEEVKKLLGEPTTVETASLPMLGTVTRYGYKTDKGEASVILKDNQVQSKAGSISQ
jgi:uncharacterized protein YycO